MSRLVATIDLSSAVVGSQGSFETQTPNNCSALYVMNESAMFLQLDLGINGQPIVQPWRNRLFTLKQPIQNAQWTVIAVLTSASAPSAAVYVEAFAPNEAPSASLDGPVFRQSNVGNGSLPVTNSSTLINDGAAAGTVIVEATPSGAAGSEAKLTNDGDFLCGGGLFHISNAGVVTAIPAGSIPVAGVASGYPAASLGAGALPAGVTLPAAQVSAGTFPTGVDLTNIHSDGGAISSNGAGALTASSYTGELIPRYGGTLNGMNYISGSGSATVNHGLSATPDVALVNTYNGSNSTTFGSGSYTATTVYIYQYVAQAWVGQVYRYRA